MVRYQDTLWCDGCGVEIRWKPVKHGQLDYCCKRCLNGEVCDCEDVLEEYPPLKEGSPNPVTQPPTSYTS